MKGFWGGFDFWEVGFFILLCVCVGMECIGKWEEWNMGECNNDNYNNNNINGFGEIEDAGTELGFHVCL